MFEFCEEKPQLGEGAPRGIETWTYIRVELITRPVEAQNERTRIVGWGDHGRIVRPRSRAGRGLGLIPRQCGVCGQSLEMMGRQARGRGLAVGLGDGLGHVEVKRWEEKFTNDPGGTGPCYKGHETQRGAFRHGKRFVHVNRQCKLP